MAHLLSLPNETIQSAINQLRRRLEDDDQGRPWVTDAQLEAEAAETAQRLGFALRPEHPRETYPHMALHNPLMRTLWAAFKLTYADHMERRKPTQTPLSGWSIKVPGANPKRFSDIFASHNHKRPGEYLTNVSWNWLLESSRDVHLHTLYRYAKVMHDEWQLLDYNGACIHTRHKFGLPTEGGGFHTFALDPLIVMIWEMENLAEVFCDMRDSMQCPVVGSEKVRKSSHPKRVTLTSGRYQQCLDALAGAPPVDHRRQPLLWPHRYARLPSSFWNEVEAARAPGARRVPLRLFAPHEWLANSIPLMLQQRDYSEREFSLATQGYDYPISRDRLRFIRTKPDTCNLTMNEISTFAEAFQIPLSLWLYGIMLDYAYEYGFE